ncbi:hypothetical protein D1115_03650 [Vibrio alfacsensis]|uniref:Molecular chaperone n=1 Tax=Vibrio alfacsensis TaxID=1074311 RepID=A0ABN5PGT3_9VIBR|nr:hypothetical protein [Vibrio alfacsensis]AXY00460.1 hypothetical protein D1115_03650 [Vibrio alfacsensis]
MKIVKLTTIIVMLSAAMNVQALGVDSLIKVMDDSRDVITISNNDGFRQFVNLSISDVDVVDGDLVATAYNKENIDSWSLEVQPSKLILDNGQSKRISIRYLGNDSREKDKVYAINVVPTPYYAQDETPPNTVQIVIGVAPYVVLAAKQDKPLAYTVKHEGEYVRVKNLGNTYFRANLKACDSIALKVPVNQCISSSHVLSGRELKIPLPEKAGNNEIEVSFSTHYNTYKETFDLTAGQVKKK